MMRQRWVLFLLGCLLLLSGWVIVSMGTAVANGGPDAPDSPVGTGFTYQGQLKQSGTVVTGDCDMAFRVFDQLSGGIEVGSPITQTVMVNEGLFTTNLDWGTAVFNGEGRWLDIQVRCPTGSGIFAPLSPRQNLTPAPYALYALNADYANVVIVAESGGDFTSIQAALDSITDNNVNQRYLIRVAPGYYYEQVTMKSYVDIEGAGAGVTTIQYLSDQSTEDTGTLIGANNAELRHISVTGGNSVATAFGVAMYNNNASPTLNDVSLTVSVLSGSNGYAILNRNGASPLMEDVTAVVAGTGSIQIGVYNDDNSSPTMNKVTAEVYLGGDNRGIYNRTNSNPTMADVTAITDQATNASVNRAIYNNGSSPLMQNVTAVARNATSQNVAIYNDAGSAPILINVEATASGGGSAIGIRTNNNSPITMQGGQVLAENSNGAIGVMALTASPITLTNSIIEAANNSNNIRGLHVQGTTAVLQGVSISVHGANSNRAVQVQEGFLTVYNSILEVGNGSSDAGILNVAASGSYTVTVHNSQITAAIPLFSDSEFATFFGGSSLNGGAFMLNGGTATCAGVYDENFVFSANACP